jgi:DNA topoisomerase-2
VVIPLYAIQTFKKCKGDKNNDLSSWIVKYYKALGSSSDYEAIIYFKNMDQNQKNFTWKDDSDTNGIDVAFDKTNVQARRKLIDSFVV